MKAEAGSIGSAVRSRPEDKRDRLAASHFGNIFGSCSKSKDPQGSRLMEIDFLAIRTDELKSRIGELRRYL
jgi:hypothetical protein